MPSREDKWFFVLLGARIRELRGRKQWTQAEMENHGFTLRHFQSVEAGKSINLVTAKRLAAAFGIDVSDLLKGLSRRARLLAAENVAESAKAWRRRPGRPTKTKK